MIGKACILLVLAGSVALGPGAEAKRIQYDKRAKALAGLLGPDGGSTGRRGRPTTGVQALGEQLARILTHMKQSDVTNGPAANNLLAQAYELRQEMCPSLATACRVNIHRQFETAEAMGLFIRKGTFNRTITRGRGLGEQVVFEHIVPAGICPEFATSLANIRLVSPDAARQSDDADSLDARTIETAKRFRSMVDEQKRHAAFLREQQEVDARRHGPSEYGMGRTREEHEEVWRQFVDEDPSVLEKTPYIDTEVKKTMSRVGYGTNQVTARITNRCQHPIEISIDFRMIGHDQLRAKASVELGRVEKNLKLLQLQHRDIELNGVTRFVVHRRKVIVNTRYRGWVLTVRHKGEVISHAAHPAFLVDEFSP